MATDLTTFASDEYTMRFRQPFVTAGLNEKHAVVIPPGIYRGFGLGVDGLGGDRTVELTLDTAAADMVAVYQTETGYSLTIRYTSGAILLSLTAYDSETVVLAIYATYALGATTEAWVRAYTEAEYNGATEKDELVVIGTVDVPAAGNPIDASMLAYEYRTMAWANQAPEALMWAPLVKNSAFEVSDAVSTPYDWAAHPWEARVVSGTATFGPSTTDPNSSPRCMELDYTSGSVIFLLSQTLGVLVEEGQRYRINIAKKMVQAATAGNLYVYIFYRDSLGDLVGPWGYVECDVSADSAYEELEHILTIPSGYDIREVFMVRVQGDSLEFAASGPAIRLDDLQVWLETSLSDPYPFGDAQRAQLASSIVLYDAGSTGDYSDLGDRILVKEEGGNLRVERLDQQDSATDLPIGLELFGQLLNLGKYLRGATHPSATPRITTPVADSGSYDYTLLWEAEDDLGSTASTARLYAVTGSPYNGGWAFTVNAAWNGASWSRDAAEDSTLFRVSRFGFEQRFHDSASASPWTESQWDADQGSFGADATGNWIDWGVTYLGRAMLQSEAWARVARLSVERADEAVTGVDPTRTLILELPAPDTTGVRSHFRLYRAGYSTNPDMLELTANARWNGTAWEADNTGGPAQRLLWLGASFELDEQESTGSPWADPPSAWTTSHTWGLESTGRCDLKLWDPRVQFTDSGSNTNPVYTVTPEPNTLYAINMIKAWGQVYTTGGGAVNVYDGFNISASISGNYLQIDFRVALDNDDYSVVAMMQFTPYRFVVVNTRATTYFRLAAIDPTTASEDSFATDNWYVFFLVIGRQSS